MALLYLDLLGVRAQWHAGGRVAAEAAFVQFRSALQKALQQEAGVVVLHGGVESDSAAVVFANTEQAIRVGRRLYRNVFLTPGKAKDQRLWVRGAIMPAPAVARLRTSAPLPAPYQALEAFSYEPELLEAIAVEKSGIKGMRLIISDALLTSKLRSQFAIQIGKENLIPFKQLANSSYPGRVRTGFSDILWMMDGQTWQDTQVQMGKRLRWAANNPEEFIQAAATQVVFHECEAIAVSLRRRP